MDVAVVIVEQLDSNSALRTFRMQAEHGPHYQERCHPSQSKIRGLDGAEQCVVTARRSRLMSEGG